MKKLHNLFFAIVFSIFALQTNAQWTGLSPNPIYTNQLVGIGTNTPEMKLHIVSQDVCGNGIDGVRINTNDIRHIRLSYLRSNSSAVSLINQIEMCDLQDNDWDISNENGQLNFKYTDNLYLYTGHPLTIQPSLVLVNNSAEVLENFSVNGNTTLHSTTTTDLSANNITTNNLSVNNITSSKLSIGAKKPTGAYANYALSVDGSIVSTKSVVQISSWADKVFDKKYKLMPLSEVEQFVEANKHLPEIPSEKEVLENGVDVGEMNKLLLQKVEELTLHLIKQDKKIEGLEKEVQSLLKK